MDSVFLFLYLRSLFPLCSFFFFFFFLSACHSCRSRISIFIFPVSGERHTSRKKESSGNEDEGQEEEETGESRLGSRENAMCVTRNGYLGREKSGNDCKSKQRESEEAARSEQGQAGK